MVGAPITRIFWRSSFKSRSFDVHVVGLCNVAPHKGQAIVRKVDPSRRDAVTFNTTTRNTKLEQFAYRQAAVTDVSGTLWA